MIQTIASLPLKDVVLAYTCAGCKTKLVFSPSNTIMKGSGCPVCGGEPLNALRNAMSAWVKFHEEAGNMIKDQLTIEIVIPSASK